MYEDTENENKLEHENERRRKKTGERKQQKERGKSPVIYWKQLTIKNLLNIIEIVLDIENYNSLVLPDSITLCAAIVHDKDKNTEIVIIFTNKHSMFSRRLMQCDMIKGSLRLRETAIIIKNSQKLFENQIQFNQIFWNYL